MYKSIIIACASFGSVYLSSISLCLINQTLLENKPNYNLLVLNGCTFLISGSIFLYIVNSKLCTY